MSCKDCKCSNNGVPMEKFENVGMKFDNGKEPIGLISSDFLLGLAKVLNFGKELYGAHNWRNGISSDRLYDAALRHLLKWNKGIDLDEHSNLNHLYHAAANIMMLCEQMQNKPELDTRFKPNKKD